MFEGECPLVAHNIKLYTTTCTNSDSNYICRFVGLQRLGPLFSLRFLPSELFKSKICLFLKLKMTSPTCSTEQVGNVSRGRTRIEGLKLFLRCAGDLPIAYAIFARTMLK